MILPLPSGEWRSVIFDGELVAGHQGMTPEKPAADLIRGGNRFSDKVMPKAT
jgi:hypothetical protein